MRIMSDKNMTKDEVAAAIELAVCGQSAKSNKLMLIAVSVTLLISLATNVITFLLSH